MNVLARRAFDIISQAVCCLHRGGVMFVISRIMQKVLNGFAPNLVEGWKKQLAISVFSVKEVDPGHF